MIKTDEKLFSVKYESVFNGASATTRENKKDNDETVKSSTVDIMNSVVFEPFNNFATADQKLNQAQQTASATYSRSRLATISILAGTAGGIFAVVGCFLGGNSSAYGILLIIAVAPFLEECLKQSGMIYLLEKKAHFVRYQWQFFVCAFFGGAAFAVIENFIYRYIYLRKLPQDELELTMTIRWTMCVFLHISCTMISAMGLRRVWLIKSSKSPFANLQHALSYFLIATAVHGTYNAFAVVIAFISK